MSATAKPNGKLYLTYKEVAERWGVNPMTVRRLAKSRRIKPTMFGGSVRFAIEEVERYEKEN